MDAYFSYDLIKMHPTNKKKWVITMKNATNYYKVILFGLKNAGATYQRLMNKVFTDQIGRITKVYVDNVVAKTMGYGDH